MVECRSAKCHDPRQRNKPMKFPHSLSRLASKRLALSIALTLGMQALPARAEDVFVTTNADSGAGSLREAFETANSGDVIVFDLPGAAPVITLASALPTFVGDVSFRNDGAFDVDIDRNGNGALTFSSGAVDPTGLILIDGGGASADADIVTAPNSTVYGDAVLSGNLTSPGTISPGATAATGSFGTFEVTGDFDASNSTVNLDIRSEGGVQSDLIIVGDTLTVSDAVMNPTFTGDDYEVGDQFTVLQANTISGAFANAGDIYAMPNNPFLQAIEDATLAANQFGFVIEDNDVDFEAVASGCNQSSAARVLDELRMEAVPLASISSLRNGSTEQVNSAIEQLSGSIYPSLIGAEINHIQHNLESVCNRVALQPLAPRISNALIAWARAYGISGQVDRDQCQTVGYSQVVGGLELGAGLRRTDGLAFYTFAHLADSQVKTREITQSADIASYRIGGLFEYIGESFYAIASGGAGTQNYDVWRSLDAFEGSEFAESSFDGSSQFGFFELGTTLANGSVVWVPHVGLHTTRVKLDAVSETGDSDFALTNGGGAGDSLRSVFGLSANQSGGTPLGLATTRVRLGWMHEYLDESETFQSQIAYTAVPTSSLEDRGVSAGRDWAVLRAQVDMGVILGGQFTTAYLGQYNSRSAFSTGLIGLEWTY